MWLQCIKHTSCVITINVDRLTHTHFTHARRAHMQRTTSWHKANSDINIILLAIFSSWHCQWFSSNGNTANADGIGTKDALRLRCASVCVCDRVVRHHNDTMVTMVTKERRLVQSNVSLIRSQIFSINTFTFCAIVMPPTWRRRHCCLCHLPCTVHTPTHTLSIW